MMCTKSKLISSLWRAVTVVIAIVGMILLLLIVFFVSYSDPRPDDPLYPVVFGVRIEGSDLIVSSGVTCPKGTKFDISVEGEESQSVSVKVRESGAIFNLNNPSESIHVFGSFDEEWESQIIRIQPKLPRRNWIGEAPFSYLSEIDLTGVKEEQGERSSQEFFFGELGWLTPNEVAARDYYDLLTICTYL